MQVPAVNIVLRKKHSSDDSGYLSLAVTIRGKQPVRKNLGYRIPEKFWDEHRQHVSAKFRDGQTTGQEINLAVGAKRDELLRQLQMHHLKGLPFTPAVINRMIAGRGDGGDFFDFAHNLMEGYLQVRKTKEGMKAKYSSGYIKVLNRVLEHVRDFAGTALAFSDIDRRWLEGFEGYLSAKLDSETTVPMLLTKFFKFLNEAAQHGQFSNTQVAGYQRPAYKNPDRTYLTLDEVKAISDALNEGKLEGTTALVAAYFLIECGSGLRFSDWSKFTVEKLIEDEAIKVRTKKTGVPVYFPLRKSPILAGAIAWIKANGVSFTLTEQEANRQLKRVAFIAGVDKEITTHVGRHTCATLLLEIGWSKEAVAEVLGVSINTVNIYAKTTRQKLRNEYERFGGL